MSAPMDNLPALMGAARTAAESGDYATAIAKAIAALATYGEMPSESQGAGGGGMVQWKPDRIQAFIAECRKAQAEARAAAGGIQRTKLTYVRPSS